VLAADDVCDEEVVTAVGPEYATVMGTADTDLNARTASIASFAAAMSPFLTALISADILPWY